MGSFVSSILTGSNPTLATTTNTAGSLEGFGQQVGEGDVTDASKYYQSILSGDPTQIAQSLAPQISSGQQQVQQQAGQNAEFGTRSGGTAASTAGAQAGERGDIIKDIGGLQSGAASGAASLGSNQLSQASTNNSAEAAMSQEQLQNMMDSVLGKGVGDVASTALNAGEGALGL